MYETVNLISIEMSVKNTRANDVHYMKWPKNRNSSSSNNKLKSTRIGQRSYNLLKWSPESERELGSGQNFPGIINLLLFLHTRTGFDYVIFVTLSLLPERHRYSQKFYYFIPCDSNACPFLFVCVCVLFFPSLPHSDLKRSEAKQSQT